MKRKTPDSVCGAARDKIKFKIVPLPEDPTYVLIEGDKGAFRFLAQLFEAHAQADDCGFQIGPNCAGKDRFKRDLRSGCIYTGYPALSGITSETSPIHQ